MKFQLVILFTTIFGQALAGEVFYLKRSPKGLLMGDAYTTLADDEYTLFYNPAILGRHSGLSIYFLNPDLHITNALDDLDRFQNFPSDAPGITDRILGLPIHLQLAATPGLKMGNAGISFLADVTTDIVLRNAIHPTLDVSYKLDRGFVAGYAFTLGKIGKKKRLRGRRARADDRNQFSLGVSIKNIDRQGIFDSFNLFGLELLNKISTSESSDINEIRRSLGYTNGQGWGVDTGVEYSYSKNGNEFNAGFSMLDLGDTKFVNTTGSGTINDIRMKMNAGVSWSQHFLLMDYSIAFDIHPLNYSIPFLRKVHFGIELAFPFFSIMYGWNGGYTSYGVGLNLFFFQLYAGLYGVELGGEFQQEEGKRAIIYLSLLDFSFDA